MPAFVSSLFLAKDQVFQLALKYFYRSSKKQAALFYGFFCLPQLLDERAGPWLDSVSANAHTKQARKNNAIDLNRTIDTERAMVQTK